MLRKVFPNGVKTQTRAGNINGAKRVRIQQKNRLSTSARHSGGYDDTIQNLRIGKDTRVIFQGITGRQATLDARDSLAWGTKIVGGVKPDFEGEHSRLGLPVLPTVRRAMEELSPQASILYVPASHAARAVEEAIEAEVPLIVAVSEHIPLHDIMRIHEILATQSKSRLVGANSPGIISPEGRCRIGFQPLASYSPGPVAVAAKSGTLSYEAVTSLTLEGVGQSLCIGVGGDPISGTGLVDALKAFETDESTSAIALIGEIGGIGEMEAADWIKDYRTRVSYPKPIVALVAGLCAVPGKVMGHAGAWSAPGEPSAEDKRKALEDAGAIIVDHPGQFGTAMRDLLPPDLVRPLRSFKPPSGMNIRSYHTMRRNTISSLKWHASTQLKHSRSLHLNSEQASNLLKDYNISVSSQDSMTDSHLVILTICRSARCPCILVVPNSDHSNALKVPFSFKNGPSGDHVTAAFKHLSLDSSASGSFSQIISALWSLYREREAVTLSMSVQRDTTSNKLRVSNPDFTFDDAAFRSCDRQEDLHMKRDTSQLHPSEVRGEEHGIVYIPLDPGEGSLVGTLVNGAGLAMNTVDCLHSRGLKAANFLDTGGKATTKTVMESMRLILMDKRVKVIFVNIFGGLTQCDMIADGVLEAMEELKPEIPVVARLRGTREIQAETKLRYTSGDYKIIGQSDFDLAVEEIERLLEDPNPMREELQGVK